MRGATRWPPESPHDGRATKRYAREQCAYPLNLSEVGAQPVQLAQPMPRPREYSLTSTLEHNVIETLEGLSCRSSAPAVHHNRLTSLGTALSGVPWGSSSSTSATTSSCRRRHRACTQLTSLMAPNNVLADGSSISAVAESTVLSTIELQDNLPASAADLEPLAACRPPTLKLALNPVASAIGNVPSSARSRRSPSALPTRPHLASISTVFFA